MLQLYKTFYKLIVTWHEICYYKIYHDIHGHTMTNYYKIGNKLYALIYL